MWAAFEALYGWYYEWPEGKIADQGFELGVSDFLRISDLGFRISHRNPWFKRRTKSDHRSAVSCFKFRASSFSP
jgi:hypothetical protein